jgi:hypothetical protein
MGSAALSGSVTHAMAPAMIALELNGHFSHIIPMLICVMSSMLTSTWLIEGSFFEMLSRLRKLDERYTVLLKITMRQIIDKHPKKTEIREEELIYYDSVTIDNLLEKINFH